MKYSHIFLDLDNTLLDFEAAEHTSFFYTAQRYGLTFGDRELALYQSINGPLWAMLERREITKDELVVRRFRELFAALGLTGIDPAAYNADYLKNLAIDTRPLPGAVELCRALRGRAVVTVATNGVSSTQHERIEKSGLAGYFDFVVVSDDAGAEKPDPRYFDRAMAVSGAADKRACIILGDSLTSDIGGGKAYGIATCWYNPKGKPLPAEAPQPDCQVRALGDFLSLVQ